MNQRGWAVLLMLVLLCVGLAALSLAFPQQSPSSLSCLMLRQWEGNALLITCDRDHVLLSLGDAADQEKLGAYLRRRRLQIGHVVQLRDEPLSAALTAQTPDAKLYHVQVEALCVFLREAICRIERTGAGELTVTVTHGDNQMVLCLPPNAFPEVSLNGAPPARLQADRHSVRIFSDGTHFTVRPDFSAWED